MNDSSLIKFLWSIFLQLNGKCWCCQHEHRSSNARISIPSWKDYRFTRNRYFDPVHCWFSPRCIIKQLKTHSNAIHSKNHWETQTLLKQILVHYHKQWPASMSYISHSHPWIEGLQSSLRSVKSCHHISQLSHNNCNNTDHRILDQTFPISSVIC